MAFWRYAALHSFFINITFISKYRLRFRNLANFVKVKSCADKRAYQPYVNLFLTLIQRKVPILLKIYLQKF